MKKLKSEVEYRNTDHNI